MEILVDGAPVDYSGLPDYMQGGMRRYVEHGIMPGSFLTAVLENDLMGAATRGDDQNRHLLFEYCQWLYSYAPRGCFGSREKVSAWIASSNERAKA